MASITSPEVESILIRTHDLMAALSNEPLSVAGILLSKGFISSEIMSEILVVSYTPTEKATILIETVRNKIEVAPTKFPELLEILSDRTCAKQVVESLRSTYKDLKDKMASQNALQPPKRTEVIDNVWKTRLAESFEGFSASQVSRDHIERAKECIDKGGTRDERYRLVPFERILNENQELGKADYLTSMTSAYDLLLKFVINLLKPNRPPVWRCIKTNNTAFKARVACMKGYEDILRMVGYLKKEENSLQFPESIQEPNKQKLYIMAAELLMARLEVDRMNQLSQVQQQQTDRMEQFDDQPKFTTMSQVQQRHYRLEIDRMNQLSQVRRQQQTERLASALRPYRAEQECTPLTSHRSAPERLMSGPVCFEVPSIPDRKLEGFDDDSADDFLKMLRELRLAIRRKAMKNMTDLSGDLSHQTTSVTTSSSFGIYCPKCYCSTHLAQKYCSYCGEALYHLFSETDVHQVEQRHLAAVQQAINKQGTLTHTTIHGVIVGIARSGKDSLLKRLLGERPSDKVPSTGVAETAFQVRVEKSSSNTVSACVEGSNWIRLTVFDDEAIEMMAQLTSKQKPVMPTQTETVAYIDACETAAEVAHNKVGVLTSNPTHTRFSESHNPNTIKDEDNVKPQREIPCVLKEALKTKQLQQHLEDHWSIYLSNTGGQMEFQELLPLLVSGPSMFFITFRLDRDLNQRYEIEYEVTSDGPHPKIFNYTSNATPLETILQTLASIDAVGTYDYSSQQRERATLTYKVFIVGTHCDLLETSIHNTPAVQSKIKEIDLMLKESVENASYFRHIKFSAEDQMIFTVDNFSTNENDFQLIRSSVEQVVITGDFATTSPSHWLIYGLMLRRQENQIESYSNCYKIAKDCGITDDDEHKEALHFIHTKMGIIRYFPVDELEQLVIIDPQVLFDKVTKLIVETFTFEHAGYHSVDDFKKGIFRFSEFDKISRLKNPDPLLTPKRFAKLLEHLRIAAPFYQYCHEKKCKVLKYFFPCALSHANQPQEQSTQTDPNCFPSLVVSFECGYRPIGLAGALIKYLMTNERGSKDFEWALLTDEIYRDQISFSLEPSCDIITLKMFPTHIEVSCDGDRCQCCPIQDTCIEICKSIKAGIDKVNSDINYINNTEPLFTFYCQSSSCSKLKCHPAKLILAENRPPRLKCPKIQRSRPYKLPLGYDIWRLQELEKSAATCDDPHTHSHKLLPPQLLKPYTQCDSSHLSTLLNQLKEHAAKWRDIGTNLSFQQGELNNIQVAPKYHMEAPHSWLSAMLSKWLERAPNDERESATLEALKAAVRKANLGSAAESLTIKDTAHARAT